jgi:radical SAM protein with 4Fe4S-binding SPASM domain
MTREQGIMNLETYQKIVNDVKDFTFIFYFNFAGEPFLNPHLFEMVNLAAEHNIFSLVDTNATLLTTKRIRELLDSKLDVLVLNIDYIQKKPFEEFRQGANFNTTIEGIKKLCDYKKKEKRLFPLIVAEVIVSRENEDHLQKIYEFAMDKIGVDNVWFKSLCFPLHSKGFYEDHDIHELVKKYLPMKSPITRYTFNGEFLEMKNPKENCDWARKSLILWDGRIAACCYDYDGQYTFGNINNTSFLDIWNSHKYRYYREKLIKFKKLELCKNCSIL